MKGLVRRPLYKRPRPKARPQADVDHYPPPNGVPDASDYEIVSALICCAWGLQDTMGNPRPVKVGAFREYDPHRDMYVVTGKCLTNQKAGDWKIEGEAVSAMIWQCRLFNGGRRDNLGLVKSVGGMPDYMLKNSKFARRDAGPQ